MAKQKERLPMLAQRLRILRYTSGLTQKQLADLLHIERCTYAFYETGKSHPDLGLILRIARIYKTTVDHLIDPDYDLFRTTTLPVRTPPISPEQQPSYELSTLSEDERKFLILYRQLTKEQKEDLLKYIWGTQLADQTEKKDSKKQKPAE